MLLLGVDLTFIHIYLELIRLTLKTQVFNCQTQVFNPITFSSIRTLSAYYKYKKGFEFKDILSNTEFMKYCYYLFGAFMVSSFCVSAQTALYSDGGAIYTAKDAIIHVEGDIENKDTAILKVDGVVELTGNFTVDNTARLKNGADNTSTERMVKFIGTGTQAIKGDVSDANNRYFYNLVIDKAVSASAVELQGDAIVKGSLVFGSATTGAATYTPTSNSTRTDNANQGVIRTYDGSNTDHELFITNASASAVAGYALLTINGAPTDAYIQTRGAQGAGTGGFARNVSTLHVPYVFPVGSTTNGYNATALTFTGVGGGTDKVRTMFVDATGGVGSISQWCSGCNGQTPDNTGFNYYFANNTCNGDAPQWVIFDALPQDHGYWSYEGNASDHYLIEAYPNSFPGFGGDASASWRLLKKSGAISAIPSGDWMPSITSSISDTADLLTYSKNSACYTGNGIPGGMYTGFSHFQMARTSNSNALPVELMYLKAQAVENRFIQLTWATALEINNHGFEVLRSTNGTYFTSLGFVNAKGTGNSTSESLYSFDDNSAEPNIQYYYKLNQLDNNAHSQMSNMVSAALNADEGPKVTECFPNPANGSSSIMIHSPSESRYAFEVYNLTGQLIQSKTISVVPGYNRYDFVTDMLAQGSYKVVVKSDKNIFTRNLNILR